MKVPKSSLDFTHYPVMLNEVTNICNPKEGESFIDCTFGGGGYSNALLKYPNTKVFALDRDNSVLTKAIKINKKYSKRFSFHNEKFSNLDKIFNKDLQADAIIFDLGLSSIQLLDMKRGFSFKSKEKIDMNMGLSSISAEEIINKCDEKSLKMIIKVFGEEKEASKIVKNIIKERKLKKISKVSDLVKIIEKSKKKNYLKKINVCTKTFQALRIFVNKEISELIEGIIKATKLVKPGGKIIVVSFHSIEDKIVKYYFSNYSKDKSKPSRYFPEKNSEKDEIFFEAYKNKLLKPSEKEVKDNFPSRSAKLRYVTRNNNIFTDPIDFRNKFKKYLKVEKINV
tara:strand:+ start:2097 stop:3116 length:1020 start_codon:yes stop_codon:yes gene_type:complete